ncbi:hypothetical protein XELAEV_18005918mg, partial [Xenopus laevis]
ECTHNPPFLLHLCCPPHLLCHLSYLQFSSPTPTQSWSLILSTSFPISSHSLYISCPNTSPYFHHYWEGGNQPTNHPGVDREGNMLPTGWCGSQREKGAEAVGAAVSCKKEAVGEILEKTGTVSGCLYFKCMGTESFYNSQPTPPLIVLFSTYYLRAEIKGTLGK